MVVLVEANSPKTRGGHVVSLDLHIVTVVEREWSALNGIPVRFDDQILFADEWTNLFMGVFTFFSMTDATQLATHRLEDSPRHFLPGLYSGYLSRTVHTDRATSRSRFAGLRFRFIQCAR